VLDAWLRCDTGGGEAQLDAMAEAIGYFRSLGARCFLPLWEARRAMFAAGLGNVGQARAALDAALADTLSSGELWAEPEVERARATVLRLDGADPTAVDGALRRAQRLAHERGTPAWLHRAGQTLAEFQQQPEAQGGRP
jgi:hypothetical protein